MKIVSPFHDFYDIGLAYDTNSDIVYLREPKGFSNNIESKKPLLVEEIISRFLKKLIGSHYWYYKFSIHATAESKKYTYTHNNYLIVFCGKAYPTIELIREDRTEFRAFETFHFYNYDSYATHLEENELVITSNALENSTKKFFEIKLTTEDVDFLIQNKITNFVLSNNSITINDNLSDYQLYKALDPYSAFQELDMWLSGILAYPQNIMLEVEDSSKIEKHGFDKKYGFRTRPTKPKKKT